MKKQQFFKPVVAVMATDFFLLASSGLLHNLIPYDTYRIVHPIYGYILIACVVIHVFLNWAWVKSNIFAEKHK
jgi:Ni,Fe-hydrogenase I cytochrome b subunit